MLLTGTKLGCGEGGCGACTVMISRWDEKVGKIHHYSVNACIVPVVAVHGCAVTTVEGVGSTKTKLHAVQVRTEKLKVLHLKHNLPTDRVNSVKTSRLS